MRYNKISHEINAAFEEFRPNIDKLKKEFRSSDLNWWASRYSDWLNLNPKMPSDEYLQKYHKQQIFPEIFSWYKKYFVPAGMQLWSETENIFEYEKGRIKITLRIGYFDRDRWCNGRSSSFGYECLGDNIGSCSLNEFRGFQTKEEAIDDVINYSIEEIDLFLDPQHYSVPGKILKQLNNLKTELEGKLSVPEPGTQLSLF